MKKIKFTNWFLVICILFISCSNPIRELKNKTFNYNEIDLYINHNNENKLYKDWVALSFPDYDFDNIKIDSIIYKDEFVGDLNKDGKRDVFAKMNVHSFNHKFSYFGLVENIEEDERLKINLFHYNQQNIDFENLKIEDDTVFLTLEENLFVWGDVPKKFRTLSYKVGNSNVVELTSPCEIDAMRNMNIFKDVKNVERNNSFSFPDHYRHEHFENNDFEINTFIKGCNYFSIGFVVSFKKKKWDLTKYESIFYALDFMQEQTRYKTILRNIEVALLEKLEHSKVDDGRGEIILNADEKFTFSSFKDVDNFYVGFSYYKNNMVSK